MRTQALRSLLISLFAVGAAIALSCSSKETLPPPGAAGAGGSGGQGGDDSAALAAELCPGACDTAKTCYSKLDVDACKAQCREELAGRGYFVREFSVPYFQKMNEIDADTNCAVTKKFSPWNAQPPTYDNVPEVAEPEVLKECSAPYEACAEGSFAAGCFVMFYVFNESRRDAMRSCFSLPCVDMVYCVGDNRPMCAPWVGIQECEGEFFLQ